MSRTRLVPKDLRVHETTRRFISALEHSGYTGEICTDYASRIVSATDNSIYQVIPQAVLYPRQEEDLNTIARVAHEGDYRGLGFFPRGGGTGINGQSLGSGIVVDVSKYLNNIISFDEKQELVTVQPGVVLDQLNAYLEERGFFFPPMVSSSSRATLGGMTGTDAAGKGSRIYGKTSDYINTMDVALADGQTWTARALSPSELNAVCQRGDHIGSIHQQVYTSIREHKDLINDTFPQMNRGLTGYNLKKVLDDHGTFRLSYILSGSEGSLCFTRRITFRVKRKYQHQGLMAVFYPSVNDALLSVRTVLSLDPAAVEFIDDKIIAMAKNDLVLAKVSAMMRDDPTQEPVKAMNIIEFVSDDSSVVAKKLDMLQDMLTKTKAQKDHSAGVPIKWQRADHRDDIHQLWEMRKRSVGLLGALEIKGRAIPFVEDTAVPPEKLPDYIEEFRALLDSYNLDYGMFGHADVGCMHVRPTMDLHQEQDTQNLRDITNHVVALVKKYGGILWGEHGKGFRAEYSPQFFGEVLYSELCKIKAAFDPENVFSPGKIATPHHDRHTQLYPIDAVAFRADFEKQISPELNVDYEKALQCNGNGACFNWDEADPMCPSFKVSRDRRQSPKGRAELLKEWMRLQSQNDSASEELLAQLYTSMDTCLSCKACTSQCPIRIDIPQMKSQFLSSYFERYPRPVRDRLLSRMERWSSTLARFPRLINTINHNRLMEAFYRSVVGLVDLPAYSTHDVQAYFVKHNLVINDIEQWSAGLTDDDRRHGVVLVQDAFTTCFDSEVVFAYVDLLRALDCVVWVLPVRDSGKALYVKGFLKEFDRVARDNDDVFSRVGAQGVSMVGIESSVTLMYQHDYPKRLSKDPDYHIYTIQEWLHEKVLGGHLKTTIQERIARLANHNSDHMPTMNTNPMPSLQGTRSQEFHDKPHQEEGKTPYILFSHCTEKTSLPQSQQQWQDIFTMFGESLSIQKTGCCGMAGVYGHEKEHTPNSKKLYRMSWEDKITSHTPQKILATGFSCRCQTQRMSGFKPQHPIQALAKKILTAPKLQE